MCTNLHAHTQMVKYPNQVSCSSSRWLYDQFNNSHVPHMHGHICGQFCFGCERRWQSNCSSSYRCADCGRPVVVIWLENLCRFRCQLNRSAASADNNSLRLMVLDRVQADPKTLKPFFSAVLHLPQAACLVYNRNMRQPFEERYSCMLMLGYEHITYTDIHCFSLDSYSLNSEWGAFDKIWITYANFNESHFIHVKHGRETLWLRHTKIVEYSPRANILSQQRAQKSENRFGSYFVQVHQLQLHE